MTNIKQVDREAAETIDCLEWLSCDNRYNPQLLTILSTHREQAVSELVDALERITIQMRAPPEVLGIARQALDKYRNHE